MKIPLWLPSHTRKPDRNSSRNLKSTKHSENPEHPHTDEVLPQRLDDFGDIKHALLSVETSDFENLSIQKLKFMYRVFFRAAFNRYLNTTAQHSRFSGTFLYAYFTPPCLPKVIECIYKDINIELDEPVL